MAKFGAGFVGILTLFLVVYNLSICATNPIDESKCQLKYIRYIENTHFSQNKKKQVIVNGTSEYGIVKENTKSIQEDTIGDFSVVPIMVI